MKEQVENCVRGKISIMLVETKLKRLFGRTVLNVCDLFVLRHALSQCWVWFVAKTATAPLILIT